MEPHSLLIHIVTLCRLQDTGTCCLNVIDFKIIFANSRTAVFHVENKAAFQWEMTEALQLGRMEPIDLVWKVAMQKDGNKQRGRLALVEVITEMWGLAETKRITNQRACVGTNTWDEVELAEEQKKSLWISFCFQTHSRASQKVVHLLMFVKCWDAALHEFECWELFLHQCNTFSYKQSEELFFFFFLNIGVNISRLDIQRGIKWSRKVQIHSCTGLCGAF